MRRASLAVLLAASTLLGAAGPALPALGAGLQGAFSISPREAPAAFPEASLAAQTEPPYAAAPSPQSFNFGAARNWSPYGPSAFTHGVVDLSTAGDSVDISALPNITVNQVGTVSVVFNGTWNPAPSFAADRDWVMVVLVLAGRADVFTLESNTSRAVSLAAPQLPARAFFGLPSAIGFVSPRSDASVAVTFPNATSARLNLTVAAAGLGLATFPTVRQVQTKSLWLNATGLYTGNGVLSGAQNVSVLVPLDDQPAVAVHRAEPRQWVGDSHFPGARLFLLHGGGGIVAISNVEVTLWTRGSPESGLFVNATSSPPALARGENLSVGGTVGNRSLLDSTNWTANTTAAVAPNRYAANCQNAVRLDNGSYRMFCNFETTAVMLTNRHGVDSAISPDGVRWAWESGVRFERCGGGYALYNLAIVRLLNGDLRMYYSGSDPLVLPCGGQGVHTSSAVSSDEGLTWADETDVLANFGVTSPAVWAVAPTLGGELRMYLWSNSGLVSALSTDGDAWSYESALSANNPRAVYQLADGSFKMYWGDTSVSSQTSPDGLIWNASQLELPSWSGDIRAGPLIDRGNGSLLMTVYSPTTGIHVAELNATPFAATSGRFSGQLSDGSAFARVGFLTNNQGRFLENVTVPTAAPLGRAKVQVTGWFGGPTVRAVVLNRPPLWSGPAVVNATEDISLIVNLSAYGSDLDPADALKYNASSAFGSLNGSNLTLLYPNGVLSDTVSGSIFDGFDKTPFSFAVAVTPVNDGPTITLSASYPATEDADSPIDFLSAIADQDTPVANLTLSTDALGAAVTGAVITFRYTLPGSYLVNIRVFDGEHGMNGTTTITVAPVDDPPVLTLDPLYQGIEDAPIVLDIAPALADEDTPFDSITVTTNLTGATVSRFNITLTRTDPGAVPFSVTVDDGNSATTDTSVLEVQPANDPPLWSLFEIRDLTEDVMGSFDVAPYITDPDNATATLAFSVVSPNATFNGSVLEMLFGEGIVDVTLTLRVSDGTSVRFNDVRVRINKVNDPPTLTGTPPTGSQSGGPVTYQFGAADPDNDLGFTYSLVTGPAWLSVSPSGLLTITPPQGLHGRANYTVRVQDAEGAFSLPVTFTFSLPANTLPGMLPDFTALPADATPGVLFWFQFAVFDEDNDTVAVLLAWDDPSQSVTVTDLGANVYVLRWTPAYNYTPSAQGFVAWLYGNLTLDDSFGTARFPFAFRAMDPPNDKPTINGTLPRLSGTIGNFTYLDLTPFMEDGNDLTSQLTWTIEGDVSAFADVTYTPGTHNLSILFTREGVGSLRLTLSDPSHANATQSVFVEGKAPVAPPGDLPPAVAGFPWWLLLLLAAAVGGGAAMYFWRSRAARAALAAAELVPTAAAEAAPAAPVMAPAAAPRSKRTFLVEDLFLLYGDGRTIYTRGGLSADAVEDAESVGAMLVAVQDFVKDSFKRGSPVDRMGYGDNVILIEKGEYAILAVTVFGDPDREFRDLLVETVRKVEMTYAGVIEKWDGSRTALKGVEAILAPVWQLTADLTRGDVLLATTAREVQMLSGVEFFQGFVRLKVGVVNNTASVITNVTVDLDFNADVLRLHKIEPAGYKSAAAKVVLGVLQAGEKATLAYYFDPQICTSSAIDGSCRYKDPEGRQHIVQMKSRQAEVVCPLFFTKEQANTAMLKRLVEAELKQFDVRAYSFKPGPADATLTPLFEAMKSAVMAHDVQTVRSFERRRPYIGEAWFYGKTQVKGYQMVIRTIVDQEKGRAEFFVASTAMRSVTGLLAELNHTFHSSVAGRFVELGLTPLFEASVRDTYADPRAVSKMLEGEAEATENEPA